MTMGKRQLVLAALVVALGAAVYLNWMLSGNNQLSATEAVVSGRELGQTLLVNASGPETSSGSSAVQSDSSAVTTTTEDYFNSVRLSRQKARDSAVDLLTQVLKDAQESDAAKKEAVTQAAEIAKNTLKENNIESLVKAKGFADCVVFIENGECSVVVKTTDSSSQEDAIVIQDIVTGQTGLTFDKIKIIESK